MRVSRLLPAAILLALLAGPLPAEETIYRYGRFEQAFTATRDYADPLRDIELKVEFTGPDGARLAVRGFWDGGRSWKVRFSPEQAGDWKWNSSCACPDKGLVKSGSFRARQYWGRNELYRHGAPRLSPDRRYFAQADGKPWLWLADTAWNGALMSTREEWRRYARDRVAKKFSAAQFVMTQWRAGRQDELGQVAFTGADHIRINPAFFQRLDEKFDALNDEGLVAGPVLLWALTSPDQESPGISLPTGEAIVLARYMVSRYGAHQVVWILGGDGDYRGANTARWKAIGQAVFPAGEPRRPVTMHPGGMQSPWAEYKDEPWLDVFFYQSGHGNNAAKWRWNATAGGAVGWKLEPAHPVVDSEINYEGHLDYHRHERIGAAQVRRAAYYSLLAAPPVGVTYGAHGIWFWSRKAEVPLDHPQTGATEPWYDCLDYPGARSMTVLHEVFNSLEWWKLRPNRALVDAGAAPPDFTNYPMPAMAQDGSFALIYLPADDPIPVHLDEFRGRVDAIWINPQTGKREVELNWRPSGAQEMHPPRGGDDWLLLLRTGRAK
jgi:hypothetical protein